MAKHSVGLNRTRRTPAGTETGRQRFFDADFLSQVDVDQFYGIEIVEFPVQIAETAQKRGDENSRLEKIERPTPNVLAISLGFRYNGG